MVIMAATWVMVVWGTGFAASDPSYVYFYDEPACSQAAQTIRKKLPSTRAICLSLGTRE